jgi:NADH:ubiquinone oxidoreductase subunit
MSASIGTRLFTWLRGEEVGKDRFGNRYYRDKSASKLAKGSLRRERRWVVYDGSVEASRVPPEWHAWLHYTTDQIPPESGPPMRPWQKEHRPNPTGTAEAYRPPGHTLEGGRRARNAGDYEPWRPE